MAMRTVASVTARVVVVVLLLSTASAHAVATLEDESAARFDGNAAATFDHQSLAGGSTDQHTNDELPRLLSQPADRTAAADVTDGAVDAGERLERAVQYGVQRLCGSGEVLPYLAALGYSRYDGSDPLTNERRADVYEHITESPGIHVSKVSDETRSHRSTVRYHVRVLEDEGLITESVLHGKHRLYPVETNDPSLVAALNDEATAAVLQALLRVEPASVSLLADDLDRAPSTVSYHLSRLAAEELVTQERDGTTVLNRLPQHVREALTSVETAGGSEGESLSVRADS